MDLGSSDRPFSCEVPFLEPSSPKQTWASFGFSLTVRSGTRGRMNDSQQCCFKLVEQSCSVGTPGALRKHIWDKKKEQN
ncbi:hypothetical protein Y1Q_0014434 [Alligator mississippiensis]|uniref:Uncharacterized protein n=1 Tax=Alligator mississippiensis TaxID=8496 RepID=A0A151PCK2_ALLMI|nr:hypothetical protein Y1Q_0014434 [Alligator mississippiensis]